VPRSSLFVTTKVFESLSDIESAIDSSLEALQLDYVDLYLIHTPFSFKSDVENQQAWAKMEAVKASGKARSIGVSNYQLSHLEAIEKTLKEMPVVNQIEHHPYLQRTKVPAYQKTHGIITEAYGSLTPLLSVDSGPLTEILLQLVKKYRKTREQILLRWCIENGVVAITRSSKQQRIEEAVGAAAFELEPEDVAKISAKGRELDFRRYIPHLVEKGDFE
jgi:diketogulonate reductase-like aldo/keto reductase